MIDLLKAMAMGLWLRAKASLCKVVGHNKKRVIRLPIKEDPGSDVVTFYCSRCDRRQGRCVSGTGKKLIAEIGSFTRK